jgi:TldD protein
MQLAAYAPAFSHYTELRSQTNRMSAVALVNGDVQANRTASMAGVSARVWDHGAWGFSSSIHQDRDAIQQVVAGATGNASYLRKRVDKGRGSLPAPTFAPSDNLYSGASPWARHEVIAFLEALDARIAKAHPGLLSRRLGVSHLSMEKQLLTSEGAHSASSVPRTLLYLKLTMKGDGEPFELYETAGGYGTFGDHFTAPELLDAQVARIAEHLAKKAESTYARAGQHEVILDAELAGILAHEAIGHTTEADLVLGGSVASTKLGKMVASPLVSLTDFAHSALGGAVPVPVHIDDEGVVAQDVDIIRQGVLQGFMHNKETALRFGVEPTGNARAYQYFDEPLIRMRNTSFLPGASKLEDMIASIDDGYYLMRNSNGQADTTSEFMFGIILGYEIKNGKLGRAIRDTTISGIAFDVLETVSMVSDDLAWSCAGMCGKKQIIPVGMGGPAIKCRLQIGGQ